MTWSKFPDEWADRREFTLVSVEDRWHYVCLILLASRGNYFDGVLTLSQARRASDHPDPDGALARLEEHGLLERSSTQPEVRLVEIDVHIAPPSKRTDKTGAERQRRKRAHDKGDHSLCLPNHCPVLGAASRSVTGVTAVTATVDAGAVGARNGVTVAAAPTAESLRLQRSAADPVTPLVTRDTGTGRDETLFTTQTPAEVGVVMIDEVSANASTGVVYDAGVEQRWATINGMRQKVPA